MARRRRLLLVGGAGRMGRLLGRFFARRGFEVSVADPAEAPRGFAAAGLDAARTADVVVVATPLHLTARALADVVALCPRGLVFDVASVKASVAPVLARARAAGLRVASVHPMFGPAVASLEGRDLIVCDAGDAAAARAARRLFDGAGLSIRTMPLVEHDPWVARTMGLAHVVALLSALVLSREPVDLGDLDGVASTSFRRLLDLALPLLEQDPALTFAIQRENPDALRVFEGLVEELGAIFSALFLADGPAALAARTSSARDALAKARTRRKRS